MAGVGPAAAVVQLQDEQVLLRPLLAGCTDDRAVPVFRVVDPGSADSLVSKVGGDGDDDDSKAAGTDQVASAAAAAPADGVGDADSDGSSVYSDAEVVEPALWAYCWSCNVFLSELLLAVDRRVLSGMPTMEFGCGSGFLGVVAALAGCPSVVCTDYIESGFPAVVKTAEANEVLAPVAPGPRSGVSTGLLDWNNLPAAAASLPGAGQYRLVIGSDVLYLPESAEPVSDMLWSMLAPGGCALIADPARAAGYSFTQLFLLPERTTSASARSRRRRRKPNQAPGQEESAEAAEAGVPDPFEAAPAATILRGSCFRAYPAKSEAPSKTKKSSKKKVTTHFSDGTADGLYLRVLEAKHVASRSGTAVEQLRLFWVCKRQRSEESASGEQAALADVAGWVEAGGAGAASGAASGGAGSQAGQQEAAFRHSMAVLRAVERGMEVLSRERKVQPPDNSAIYPPGSRQAAQAVLDGLPERLLRPEGEAGPPRTLVAATAAGANYSPALFGGEANDL